MAEQSRFLTNADFGIGLTEVAGPDELEGHPAGIVFIAIASRKEVRSIRVVIGGRSRWIGSLHRNFICFQFSTPFFIKCLKFDIICGVYLLKRRRKIWLKTKKIEEVTKKFGDERKKALDDALKVIEKRLW